jgi:hypothetical protein
MSKFIIRDGLQVVPLPQPKRDQYGNQVPKREDETLVELNQFFASISAQGGKVEGVISQQVETSIRVGVGKVIETRTYIIVSR